MHSWPDHRLLDLLGIAVPILQAPMAGTTGAGELTQVLADQALAQLTSGKNPRR